MPLQHTATYDEFLDDRGRRYVVRLCIGMRAAVMQLGPTSVRIDWRKEWGRYEPRRHREATAERLIQEFERRQEPAEQVNELLAAAGRQPAKARLENGHHHDDSHDRQLPVADRA
jgi:hypothetical protein